MSLLLCLKNPESRGYPLPYVLARIRGRRSRLGIPDVVSKAATMMAKRAETVLVDTDTLLAAARTERNLLWLLLEPCMRNACAPLFFYHELKPLIVALRRREARQWGQVSAIMEKGLFINALRQPVEDERIGTQEALERMGRFLQRISPRFGLLGPAYASGRIGAVEELLWSATLAHSAALTLLPCLQTYLCRLIDMFNLLTLYRRQRWHTNIVPIFVPGGRIRTRLLLTWLHGSGTAARDACIAALTGCGALPENPTELEQELISGMSLLCRRLARDPEGGGLLVEYIWNLSQEVHERLRTGQIQPIKSS